MRTVLVEINDPRALHLLEDLEGLNILRIIKENETVDGKKISDKYKGAFSQDDAISFEEHTRTMRNEWDSI